MPVNNEPLRESVARAIVGVWTGLPWEELSEQARQESLCEADAAINTMRLLMPAEGEFHLAVSKIDGILQTYAGACEALARNQRQLDQDGCEVGVSRQAADECAGALNMAAIIAREVLCGSR